MNSSGHQQQPPRAIRAGLSVQELKAMTAARMAQSGDQSRTHFNLNPATSYQTATPQQLQAAGITPVVINDRSRNFRLFRGSSTASTEGDQMSKHAYESVNRISSTHLSPYHQQILPRRENLSFDHRSYNRDDSNAEISERLRADYRVPRNGCNENSGRSQQAGNSFELFPEVSPRSSNFALPSLNSTPRQHSNGPEVRSPSEHREGFERSFIPDEESEIYQLDSLYSALSIGAFENVISDSKRPPLSRAYSNPGFQSESSFTLPNAGSNVISSSFLPSVLPFSTTTSGHVPSTEEVLESSTHGIKGSDKGAFPFKKAKTAPKLGSIISTGTSSPVESPTLKLLGRKNLGYPISLSPLRDRNFVDSSNFLASEVAESVLDTPSSSSTPLGRKFFQQETPSQFRREYSGSTIQPIDVSERTRSVSDELNTNPPVSNQCEIEEATETNRSAALYLDVDDNSPTVYLNSVFTQTSSVP